MNKIQVHVVPHMHWDREWYFSAEESKVLLINNMEEILNTLETNVDYPCFVMDGQTAILEDYDVLVPENKTRIQKLVAANRLRIGPWYTQSDEMVVGAESITRNLLYGALDCETYGERMLIGYLPDSFGQSSQLPMILNEFNIERCMFWRGVSERKGTVHTEFKWKSDDGSMVVTQLLPLGYAIGKYLPEDQKSLSKRMDKYNPVLDRGTTGMYELLPNGHDQMPIQTNIASVIESLNAMYRERHFFLSSFESLFDTIETNKTLDTIQGECLDGKYMRVHRSIYSSRADIKALNTKIEQKITNVLEPLASIAYTLGFTYFHGSMEQIWKTILKNHAHDSIGCCCSDEVHLEIKNRFLMANQQSDVLIQYYMRKISDAIFCEQTMDKLVFFNLLPYARTSTCKASITTKSKGFKLLDSNLHAMEFTILSKSIIDAGLIDRQLVHYGDYEAFYQYDISVEVAIEAMGYTTLFVEDCKQPAILCTPIKLQTMENKYYKITIESNGTLTIFDKKTSKTTSNALLLEDGSDDGDGYDYSPLVEDFVLTSKDVNAGFDIQQFGTTQKATVHFDFPIPKDLNSRSKQLCDSILKCKYTVELKKDSHLIQVKWTVDNHAVNHRVRFYLENEESSQQSFCDNQFGCIHRDSVDEAMDVWKQENWSERPDSIYPMLSYVGLDGSNAWNILTNSIREYEVVGSNLNTLAITLFRSTQYLGKENLVRRPGRPSGIRLETKDSQMLGIQEFEVAIVAQQDEQLVAQFAKEYTTPVQFYNKTPYNAMKMNAVAFHTPLTYSLLEDVGRNVVLSTLKKAEKTDDLLLRFYNASKESVQPKWKLPSKNCTFVNLLEQPKNIKDTSTQWLKANSVQTIAFRYKNHA